MISDELAVTEPASTSDPVHHPSHYLLAPCPCCGTPIEVRYLIQEMPYFRGAAAKYILRAGKKDGAPEIQDLEKAIECIQIEIERLKEES